MRYGRSPIRGVARNLFLGGIKVVFLGKGGIKLLNSRSDVILPHKKFTWVDIFFGGGRGYKYQYTPLSLRPCLQSRISIVQKERFYRTTLYVARS